MIGPDYASDDKIVWHPARPRQTTPMCRTSCAQIMLPIELPVGVAAHGRRIPTEAFRPGFGRLQSTARSCSQDLSCDRTPDVCRVRVTARDDNNRIVILDRGYISQRVVSSAGLPLSRPSMPRFSALQLAACRRQCRTGSEKRHLASKLTQDDRISSQEHFSSRQSAPPHHLQMLAHEMNRSLFTAFPFPPFGVSVHI